MISVICRLFLIEYFSDFISQRKMAEVDFMGGTDSNKNLRRNPSNPRDFFAKIYESNIPTTATTVRNVDPKLEFNCTVKYKGLSNKNMRNNLETESENNLLEDKVYSNKYENSAFEDECSVQSGPCEQDLCVQSKKEKLEGGIQGQTHVNSLAVSSDPVLADQLWSLTPATSRTCPPTFSGIQWRLFKQMSGASGDVSIPPAFSSYRK